VTAKFIWRNDPMRFVGHVEGIAKKRAYDLSKAIFDGIVSRTPVLTGSARANWHARLGGPDVSVVKNEPGAPPLPAPSFPFSSLPAYAKVYISNATPYIMELEYGWSRQAPYGMVRVTLAQYGITLRVRG
jgi:hypothetical protein